MGKLKSQVCTFSPERGMCIKRVYVCIYSVSYTHLDVYKRQTHQLTKLLMYRKIYVVLINEQKKLQLQVKSPLPTIPVDGNFKFKHFVTERL